MDAHLRMVCPMGTTRVSEYLDHSVEIAPGVKLHRQARVELTDYRGYDISARVHVADSGKVEVTSLEVSQRKGGEPVTGAALRSIAVQKIVREFVRVELSMSKGHKTGTTVMAHGLLTKDEARAAKDRGPTAETLDLVAQVYRLAVLMDDAPTKAVEEVFEVSRSTAGAWIGRARSAGLLEAPHGKA